MYYLNCFFIYSFIGYIYENFIEFIRGKKMGSGMLYSPFTPIYGIGALIIIITSKIMFSILKLNQFLEIFIVLMILTIILTFLELLGGRLIEKIFHVTFWDYSYFKFHIGKYVALEVSFIWLILSLILIYIVHPFINKFIYLIPNYITYILIVVIIIDLIIVFSKGKVHR